MVFPCLARTGRVAMLVAALTFVGCDGGKRQALRELRERGTPANGLSLHAAVGRNDVEEVRLLLEAGVFTGQRNEAGEQPLHVAVRCGWPHQIRMLVDAGADLDARTTADVSPLAYALARGDEPLVETLLAAGVPVAGKSPDGETLVAWAIREGRTDQVRRLLAAGADPHQEDVRGNPLVHVAMEAGRRELVDELIRVGADCGAPSAEGESLVSVALRQGWRERVPSLVRGGADPNLPDRHGLTPLARALAQRDRELARELLSLGSVPAAGGLDAELARAYRDWDRELCRLLLGLGANPSPSRERCLIRHAAAAYRTGELHLFLGYAPVPDGLLHESCVRGRTHVVSLLLAHGADPNPSRAPFLDTLLSRAVRDGSDGLARRLLDAGADPRCTGPGGIRPLHLALVRGRAATVRRLLEQGEAVNVPLPSPMPEAFVRQVRGKNLRWLLRKDSRITPLMVAVDSGSVECARALLDHGARTNVWTRRYSMWPINLAAGHEDIPMMRLLLGKDPYSEQRRITINLSEQRLRVFDASGAEVFQTKVSTGKSGYRTPPGDYAITNRHRHWTSTIYHSSMPYFQRLSCRDFGMHQGYVPGYPASHGCIRLPAGKASKLFALLELGDRVRITP